MLTSLSGRAEVSGIMSRALQMNISFVVDGMNTATVPMLWPRPVTAGPAPKHISFTDLISFNQEADALWLKPSTEEIERDLSYIS